MVGRDVRNAWTHWSWSASACSQPIMVDASAVTTRVLPLMEAPPFMVLQPALTLIESVLNVIAMVEPWTSWWSGEVTLWEFHVPAVSSDI